MQKENEVKCFSNELDLYVEQSDSEESPDFWELRWKSRALFFKSLSDAEEYVANLPYNQFNKNQLLYVVGRKFTVVEPHPSLN